MGDYWGVVILVHHCDLDKGAAGELRGARITCLDPQVQLLEDLIVECPEGVHGPGGWIYRDTGGNGVSMFCVSTTYLISKKGRQNTSSLRVPFSLRPDLSGGKVMLSSSGWGVGNVFQNFQTLTTRCL